MRTPSIFALLMIFCAAPAAASEAAWQALSRPGAVAMMRHALAPGTGDPAGFDVADCTTQRNLDARGRAQARAIGDLFRANGIDNANVLSSAWCRSLETARLLDLGPVETLPALNSFFANRADRAPQTEALRSYLAKAPDAPLRILVTHQVNISALTGEFTRSGEMVVLQVAQDGTLDVTGAIAVPVPPPGTD
ncbi:histidine phosphatase family protein [Acuticoccus sp. MNP-M23]|uniref:histidine phosphatase family protein n=1 Tax=Acuticoccus sp. MNP-M23 TaxID=3072793 RepID=UPI0028163D38|nr:histidine phosphatase family protein [Acuticoccus sp. MNP-M23]WMS44353.1 histidine phosphatase family protein [Acuticoccus sp. MNP-M23]